VPLTGIHRINAVPWVELVGVVRYVSADKSYAYVEIANKLLRVNQGTTESDVILDAIRRMKVGKKIGILFTDLPDKPVAIRAVSHNPSELCKIKNLTGKDDNSASHRKE